MLFYETISCLLPLVVESRLRLFGWLIVITFIVGLFLGWFGLRKDFCPWLLGVCPVLQEYGNISYKVQSAAEENEQREQDAQNTQRKPITTPPKKGGSISEENPRTVVPMMAIDVPD